MIEIFTWCPRVNPTEDITYKTRRAKFGDGYEQVSGDGLTPAARSGHWNLPVAGSISRLSVSLSTVTAA